MLDKVKALLGYNLNCLDGEIGRVKEFYFDDKYWAIRYLVVDTGTWLQDRSILISPYAITAVNKEKSFISVNVTKKQIEGSPGLHSDEPVSRQYESDYHKYFGWPTYWDGPFLWGSYPFIQRDQDAVRGINPGGTSWDYHLRSTSVVTGYKLHAMDGEIGHIEDFIIDEDTWSILYLIIDTQNWRRGKRVLIVPKWIKCISWTDSKVFTSFTRDAIQGAPECTEESLLTREYEIELFRYYKKHGFWDQEKMTKKEYSH